MQEKLVLCEKINSLLLETKQEYLKKCKSCGFPLPPGFKFDVCDRCFRRQLRRGGQTAGQERSRKPKSQHGWEMGFKLEWFDPEE